MITKYTTTKVAPIYKLESDNTYVYVENVKADHIIHSYGTGTALLKHNVASVGSPQETDVVFFKKHLANTDQEMAIPMSFVNEKSFVNEMQGGNDNFIGRVKKDIKFSNAEGDQTGDQTTSSDGSAQTTKTPSPLVPATTMKTSTIFTRQNIVLALSIAVIVGVAIYNRKAIIKMFKEK